MLRDKIRCPICKKEMRSYSTADDREQIFLLTKEDTPEEQPIRVSVYTCGICGNVQLFGIL